MFYFPNLLGLRCRSKWLALLHGAGSLRCQLQLGVHEERLLVRLFEHVLQRYRLSGRTNLFRRNMRRWRHV